MNDGRGHKVQIGDKVELWPNHIGHVVCSLDDAQFTPAYPESEWGHLKTGALIETEDGNLFHYAEPDEDFRIVQKASHLKERSAR